MKKVRKLLPPSIYVPGMEHWLEEQANAGLFPVFLDAWVTFIPTGVPGTRFRLEPWGKTGTEPSEEQLALYRNAGWEYALTVGHAYFLFYTADHQSRGLSLERLEKRVHSYRRTQAIVCAILAALLVWVGFFFKNDWDVQRS